LLIVASNLISQDNPNKEIIDNRAFYPKQQFISYTVPISVNITTDRNGMAKKTNFKKEDLSLLRQKRLSDYIRKDLIETIFKKIKSGQISAYDPSSGCGWNLGPSNGFIDCPTKKIDGTFNEEYLKYNYIYKNFDEYNEYIKTDKKINCEVDDISSITFYENWYFDIALKKPLNKKVLGYTINVLPRNPENNIDYGYKPVPLIYIKCEDVKEKKMNLIAKNYITSTNIKTKYQDNIYDYSSNNNFNMDFRVYLFSSIINLSQKPEVYLSKWNIDDIYNNDKGEFPYSEKLSNKEIVSKSGFSYRKYKYDDYEEPLLDENGYEIYETMYWSYKYWDFISLGFVENWFFDSETLSISKDVKGFMPAVESQTQYLGPKELFYIKF
jgi:hypothetical protein